MFDSITCVVCLLLAVGVYCWGRAKFSDRHPTIWSDWDNEPNA